jgi:hypothetical protein
VLGSSHGQHGRIVQWVIGMKDSGTVGENSAVAINGRCGAIAYRLTTMRVYNHSFAPMSMYVHHATFLRFKQIICYRDVINNEV